MQKKKKKRNSSQLYCEVLLLHLRNEWEKRTANWKQGKAASDATSLQSTKKIFTEEVRCLIWTGGETKRYLRAAARFTLQHNMENTAVNNTAAKDGFRSLIPV